MVMKNTITVTTHTGVFVRISWLLSGEKPLMGTVLPALSIVKTGGFGVTTIRVLENVGLSSSFHVEISCSEFSL